MKLFVHCCIKFVSALHQSSRGSSAWYCTEPSLSWSYYWTFLCFFCLFVFVHSRGNIWVWWNKFSMWDWHQAAHKPTEKRGGKKHKKLSSMIWYDGISSLCFSWCKVMFDVFSSLPVFLFKIKKYVKYCIIWINKRSAVYYFCGVISFYVLNNFFLLEILSKSSLATLQLSSYLDELEIWPEDVLTSGLCSIIWNLFLSSHLVWTDLPYERRTSLERWMKWTCLEWDFLTSILG